MYIKYNQATSSMIYLFWHMDTQQIGRFNGNMMIHRGIVW